MKAKLIRRISTFLLVTTMMFVLSFTTFAVEYKTNDEISDTSGNVTSEEVVPLAVGTPVRGTVQPKDTLYLYPELYSYVGFQRTF